MEEERRKADDQKVQRPEHPRLAAMAEFVEKQPVVGGFPEIDEIAQGHASLHVAGAH